MCGVLEGFCFGIGVMSAFFQDCGRRASRNEQFRMFDQYGECQKICILLQKQTGHPRPAQMLCSGLVM